jgi:hypothetical protein
MQTCFYGRRVSKVEDTELDAVEVEIGFSNAVKVWPPSSTEKVLRGWSKRNAANFSTWRTDAAMKKPPRKMDVKNQASTVAVPKTPR